MHGKEAWDGLCVYIELFHAIAHVPCLPTFCCPYISLHFYLVHWNIHYPHIRMHAHTFRQNEECGVMEELEPIDSNLKYDFNYQV